MATINLGKVVGEDGKSAYDIWLGKGNTGTEQDFLDSLKGKDGTDGKDGINGVDGKDGANGKDGSDYILTAEDKQEIEQAIEVNIPTKNSQLENDKNYATESFVTNKIAEAELSGGEVDLSGLATKDELNNKVDKVTGKSLIADTEIERLKAVTNYDDTELKNQINAKASITDMTNYIAEHKEELKGDTGATGPQGEQGEKGATGEQGAAGKDGTNGVGISKVEQTTASTADGGTNVITVTKTDGTSSTFSIKNGTKGSTGDTGPQGEQGPKGDTGAKGDKGDKGDNGYTPVKGTDYWTEADKTEIKEYVADVVPTKTSELTNDSMFVDSSQVNSLTVETVNSKVEELQLVNEQEMKDYVGNSISNLSPEFVDSVDQMTDTSKKYVLSKDGYIYAYMQKTFDVIHNANDGTCVENQRSGEAKLTINDDGTATGATAGQSGMLLTQVIKLTNKTAPYNIKFSGVTGGIEKLVPNWYDAAFYIWCWKADGTYIKYLTNNAFGLKFVEQPLPLTLDLSTVGTFLGTDWKDIGYIRIGVGIKGHTTSISASDYAGLKINIEKLNTTKTEWGFFSTNQKYSSDEALSQIAEDVAEVITRVEELEKGGGSGSVVSSGANWYALGDSITYGGYAPSLTEYKAPIVGKRWVDYVAKYNGYNLSNFGISGSGYLTGTNLRSVVNSIVAKDDTENFKNADLVTIMLGINDWKSDPSVNKMGSMDDDVQTGGTIVSELRYGLETIIAQNPLCKIFVITPLNAAIGSRGSEETNWGYGYDGNITVGGSLKQFGDKLKEVCKYYGIEVIDMTNSSVANRKSIMGVLGDGLHPTLDGYKAIGLELARKITFA